MYAIRSYYGDRPASEMVDVAGEFVTQLENLLDSFVPLVLARRLLEVHLVARAVPRGRDRA